MPPASTESVSAREEMTLQFILGALITLGVYISLGFKQIKSDEEEEREKTFQRQNSNLHPDLMDDKRTELLCIALERHNKFE